MERDGFFIQFTFFWLLDGGLPLSRTPKATESAIHIDTTCQFSVRQVAGGRRVVSCGFAGVTRPAATKRTNKDSKERYRGTEEERCRFGEGLTAG